MPIKMKNPSHPGDILKHEFLEPMAMSEGQLARRLGVPRTRIERLTKGTTGMTPDTAFRLAKFFGTSPEFWINMQVNYDLAHTHVDVSGIEPLSA
ncbi:MAG: HigA family addiction module antitoxin [Paracoccaceae bacterium]|nr:HigA family addiction module antitoxin [Paracoccaceae bacterium]